MRNIKNIFSKRQCRIYDKLTRILKLWFFIFYASFENEANNSKIEQVQHFNYVGSWLTSDARCEKEIRRRINLAKLSFNSEIASFPTSENEIFEMFRVVGSHALV